MPKGDFVDADDRWRAIRWGLLRSSRCTVVQLERRRKELLAEWARLKEERRALERERDIWLWDGPRPVPAATWPFCFVPGRMKRRWREADRDNDSTGRPVDRTIGATAMRRRWFELLAAVIRDDTVVRIRHRYEDEPAVLMRESRFREMERAITAGSTSPPR